jgi:hypothetical protein
MKYGYSFPSIIGVGGGCEDIKMKIMWRNNLFQNENKGGEIIDFKRSSGSWPFWGPSPQWLVI